MRAGDAAEHWGGHLGPCSSAAEGGHLAVLRWLREIGCPWDAHTCARAAQGGHLEVLKWARRHDAPWDESTFLAAAEAGAYTRPLSAQLERFIWDRGCA